LLRRSWQPSGKIAFITGAANGIGAATAQALAAAGARVVISDIDGEAAARTAARIGRQATAIRLDVADRAAFTDALDDVERTIGPIDVLINNAAVMPLSRLDDENDAATSLQLAVNLHAAIHGTREAMRRMRLRGTGYIVNLSSTAGKIGMPGAATYSATKHALMGLSDAARGELRHSGVHVSCVLMPVVPTDLTLGFGVTRLMSPIPAEQVADAIIRTLRRPRFEVYAPRRLRAMFYLTRGLLPRTIADWVLRQLRVDRVVIAAIGSPERGAYEARLARQVGPHVAQTAGTD
jgi:NAD(P)-dependent dehydrogenase (short-subunit alcohol dehydrogenase family)